MSRPLLFGTTLLLGALMCSPGFAQRRQGPPPGRGGQPPRNPLLMLLDTDRDGAVSFAEVEKLVKLLKSRDANGDGKLTADELPRPPFGNRARGDQPGPGGPPAQGNMLSRLRSLDADGNGLISKDEAPERMKAVFDRIDANGDGQLDKDELAKVAERFRAGAGQRQPPQRGAFVERLMNLDTNGDGKVTKDEAPENMQRLFDRADADGDGALTKEELEKAAEQLRNRRPPADDI